MILSDSITPIIAKLKSSLDDYIFTRTERRELTAMLQDAGVNNQDLSLLRSHLFNIARARITPDNINTILDWLEKANKALIPDSSQLPEPACDIFFSPQDDCIGAICNFIGRARHTLRICVFTISDNHISDRLIQAHRANINIRILTDNDKVNDAGSDIERLHQAGIPVRIDRSSNHMHHKFAICDNREALTGSYNWTYSAARFNQENLIITDHRPIVQKYLDEYDNLWQQMAEY